MTLFRDLQIRQLHLRLCQHRVHHSPAGLETSALSLTPAVHWSTVPGCFVLSSCCWGPKKDYGQTVRSASLSNPWPCLVFHPSSVCIHITIVVRMTFGRYGPYSRSDRHWHRSCRTRCSRWWRSYRGLSVRQWRAHWQRRPRQPRPQPIYPRNFTRIGLQ